MNKILKKLEDERIAFVGLGIDNYALLSFLAKQKLKLDITVFEGRSAADLGDRYTKLKKYPNISWKFGLARPKNLADFSLIFKSPGALFSQAERKSLLKQRILVTSALQLFLELCPTKNIVGVTGTKGKGTTSSLIQLILKKAGKRVWLGGNIGVAVFDFLPRIKKADWVVLELSSFQLEDMQPIFPIAVLTNFSAEHLAPADPANPNFHSSLNAYWQAKLRIARFQHRSGTVIANESLRAKLNTAKLPGKIIYTKTSSLPTKLPGDHNKENIAAAVAVARLIKIPEAKIARAVASFKGLPYRLEKITVKNDISYYNDSFSTTPSSAITALKAFTQPVILIAGGADKGADFSALAKVIKRHAKAVILFKGAALQKLVGTLKKASYNNIQIASSMKEAIAQARRQAVSGDVILMSPACASFGLFKNYKDRGEQFNREIKK
jgi:UDP-N-acetylmuramoylalanine--D-glutamate ligase